MPLRALLVAAGILSLVLALLGLLLPLLPSTPFLLLSAGCLSRGSTRLHRWLLRLPLAGQVLDDYERTGGISLRSKRSALLMLWLMTASSALWLVDSPVLLAVMTAIAACASGVVLRLPVARARAIL